MNDDFDNLINAVTVEVGVPPGGYPNPVVPKPAIQKLNYSHDGLINLILANRGISQNELAARMGYSASWISQIMSSDAFQAKLLERAHEIEDPTLRSTIEDGLKGMLSRSMEVLKEKLDGPSASIPDNLALRTLELSSRALGYGAREQTVAVQVNIDQHLEELGGRLTGLLQRKKSETQPPIEVA
jgi:transcriptional regulator with XRE-family HTH domain